jgi:hypothetical protein
MRRALWALAIAAAMPLIIGCEKGDKRRTDEPKEKANLPSIPDMVAKAAAEKYQDGVWSVEGLLRHAGELAGQDVTVRGHVLSLEMCKPGAACKAEPHILLVDDLKNPRKRLVVVGPYVEYDLTGMTQGSAQTLAGKVAMWSPSGRLINMDGVLVLPMPKPPEAQTP